MSGRKRRLRTRMLTLGVAAVGVVAIAGTALAGHQTSDVRSYTGCLVSGEGVMIKIKEGNSPRSACTGGQVEAHFSGGDITKISVGSGLTLPNGGGTGEVRIELAAGQTLPSGCAAGRVAEWSGSAWICGVDNDTTYDDGIGLNLSASNVFSIDPDYRVKNTSDCAAAQFARGFASNGEIECAAAPAASGIEVWHKRGTRDDLPKGEGVDLVIMPLPTGTFLVTAVASVRDGGGDFNDEEVSVQCLLRNGSFGTLPVGEAQVDIGDETGLDGPAGTAVVHGIVSLAAADSVRFTCTSSGGDSEEDRVLSSALTAVKVGTLHAP